MIEKIYAITTKFLIYLIVFGCGVLVGSEGTRRELLPVIEKLQSNNQIIRYELIRYKGHVEAIEGLRKGKGK